MDERLFYPATKRNQKPIAEVLKKHLPSKGIVLEVASGSGEHGTKFQKDFPMVTWQTSEKDYGCRKSISSWIRYEGLEQKMPEPLNLSVEKTPWNIPRNISNNIGAIVCINLLHITPWETTLNLLVEASKVLTLGSPLIIYGPFIIKGSQTVKSNQIFDKSLRERNSNWGLRGLNHVINHANKNGFTKNDIINMPANNLSIILKKQ